MNKFSLIAYIGNNRIPPKTDTNCRSLEIRYSGVKLYSNTASVSGPFAEWHSRKGFPPDEWIQYEFPTDKLICRRVEGT